METKIHQPFFCVADGAEVLFKVIPPFVSERPKTLSARSIRRYFDESPVLAFGKIISYVQRRCFEELS